MIGIHHAMRLLFALLLVVPSVSRGQGPYTALLITGDTIRGKEYFIRRDSLGFVGGARVPVQDVVYFYSRKERWTFTQPEGKQERIRQQLSDSCGLSGLIRLRNGYRLTPYDSLPIPDVWKADSLGRSCYEDWLGKRLEAIEEEDALETERGRFMVKEGNGGVGIGEPNQIILRSGDTLVEKKDLYSKDGLLCAYGGSCVREKDVLLVRTAKGQFFYHPARKYKFRLRSPIPDMSPGSQGRLHANMLFGTEQEWDAADIPPGMRTDTVFLASYRTEVHRLMASVERARSTNNTVGVANGAMRGISGGLPGMIVGAAVGAAFSEGKDKRPFFGTPMPPE